VDAAGPQRYIRNTRRLAPGGLIYQLCREQRGRCFSRN
jgi:hypothetical protein